MAPQFNIKTGITAGPVWNQSQVNQSVQRMQNPPSAMPQFPSNSRYSAQTMGDFGQHFGNMLGMGANSLGHASRRYMAPPNAGHYTDTMIGRGGSGVNWANRLANDYGAERTTQQIMNNSLLQLLQGFF